MKFEIFEDGRVVDKFKLRGAYLFGTDGIAIRRVQITSKKNLIECKKPTLETAGLVLVWPIDGFGQVLLATTCLPERPEPYNLNLELARAKLMQIINKREDWSFFDRIEGLAEISKQAQDLFIQAIQNISNPAQASKLADESLKKAIILSEKLAAKQAESMFNNRRKNRGFSRGCFGCRMNAAQITDSKYVEALLGLFGFVMIPINWARIEPDRGSFDFSKVDACINLLSKKKLAIGAGPLLCFSKKYLPKWLLRSPGGFEKLRDTAYQFVSKVVSRYGSSVHTWSVISGMNVFNHFGFSFEQVLEMTRAANMAVKAISDRAIKIVEVGNPWGEYYARKSNTIPPLVYVDMVIQSGINFDAFGLQMQFGKDQAGMYVRDMMQISSVLDYFGPLAKPLYITGVEVPDQDGGGSKDQIASSASDVLWDQQRQVRWIEQFYKVALGKPFVDSVVYSNLADTDNSAMPNSGLLNKQFEPKKSFQTLKKLQESIFSR